MKIDFEALVYASEALGWTKTVALVRNGLESDILSETECKLALTKLQAMFEHYNWFELQQGEEWYLDFNASAFDLSKPFTMERELDNLDLPVAGYNKTAQKWESNDTGNVMLEYPVIGEGESECIMIHGSLVC